MSTLNTTVYMNPLEQFEIKEFFYFGGPLLGAKFSLTNIGLYLIIVTFLILAMSYLSLNNNKVVPSRWSLVALIPLNIYSYLARALSLGLRLTANMTVNFALSIVLIILIFNFFFEPVRNMELFLVYSFIPTFIYCTNNNKDDSFNEKSFTPLVIYSNADSMKEKIISDNVNKLGIYRWVNNISGKSYIGSSVNLSKRFRQYFNYNFITIPSKKNSMIYSSLLKYGYSNFSLEILEFCNSDNIIIEREQFYINSFKPEYNILKIAGSSLGHKASEETKKKISLARIGKRHNEETIALFKARVHTDEVKLAISKAVTGINSPVAKTLYVYYGDNPSLLYKKFNTLTEGGKFFECHPTTLIKYIKLNKLYLNKWKLSLIELEVTQ